MADICREYDCKVVISASAKQFIDEETMEIDEDCDWIKDVFGLFKKYGIDCIGRTPIVSRKKSNFPEIPIWKEDEIRLYLYRHPEIEHYCVIDDDDTLNTLHWHRSDLDKVRKHLVTPLDYSDEHPEETGLFERHKEEVGRALQEENEVKRLVLKINQRKNNKNSR